MGFEPHWNNRTMQNGTSPWRSYMTIGGAPTVRMILQNSLKMHLQADGLLLDIETAS
jgi:hypothetical protein